MYAVCAPTAGTADKVYEHALTPWLQRHGLTKHIKLSSDVHKLELGGDGKWTAVYTDRATGNRFSTEADFAVVCLALAKPFSLWAVKVTSMLQLNCCSVQGGAMQGEH